MSKMISVASGFQYSVNIGYDLNNDEKIKNFIPITSALNLLEDILLSTLTNSTDRARVLIGAYGKGKSHIMLMILSMLMKKDISLFDKILKKAEGTKLHQSILNYYESDNKILPIVVTGSNTSLTQAFLLALQRTLSSNDFLDVMPETNYKAAVFTIKKWEKEFPETYNNFCKQISMPVDIFLECLSNFDIKSYEEFETIYPRLTAGSIFNPFLGFDVVELYENVAKGLKNKGYTGIYVVYDEFSKYLEANISTASVSDTKMLQDFAEKCNRSGSTQMHIMLISHKEIANYIDVLPKQKIDGWRGVSERFLHVRLSNNFTQTYEIIESVIQKDSSSWITFCQTHNKEFEALENRYIAHPIFDDMNQTEVKKMIYGCYPLQPVSTFILPRLSERVAQNERTLFTFLSANGVSTLPAFLDNYKDDIFQLITPDLIYDYFEPLFKKEVYLGSIRDNYVLTEIILDQLEEGTIETKIIKTISLIYILEQFEKLKPTKEELYGIFSTEYGHDEIEAAINELIEKEYVIYLKRSNHYLQLKQSSGVDIQQKISDVIEAQKDTISIDEALNEANFDNYMYPSRYNDTHEMVRYFSFSFVAAKDVMTLKNTIERINADNSDGMVFGVLPDDQESIAQIKETLLLISEKIDRAVFILPKTYIQIEQTVREYRAALDLRSKAIGDRVLFDEYEVVYEDLRDIISSFIAGFTRPELFQSTYIYGGKVRDIKRKAALTDLLSQICDDAYSKTPIINNEALNRNEATSMARNSRNKVVAALLRSELEPRLGLNGTGQEVSIMRSTLIRTGILENIDSNVQINLCPKDQPLISEMMAVIKNFILSAQKNGTVCFSELYKKLCSPENKIAMRKELVPIFLAAVLHEYKQDVMISDRLGQVLLNADLIVKINAAPENYYLDYLEWNPDKVEFLQRMESIFGGTVVETEKSANSYDYIIFAMKRWYISLPKYVKDMKISPSGKLIDKGYANFLKLLRQNHFGYEFLFEEIPLAFGYEEFVLGVVDNIRGAKCFYDEALEKLKAYLNHEIKELFTPATEKSKINRMSLTSVIRDWCEELDNGVFEQLFPDGTDRCLGLFKTISNDEDAFIVRLAKLTTDLRLEDWDDNTVVKCLDTLRHYKSTAESFHRTVPVLQSKTEENLDTYQVIFVDEDGNSETKRFERVSTSNRAKLLLNKITADVDSFGQAISEAEKRQVIMEVLKKLC